MLSGKKNILVCQLMHALDCQLQPLTERSNDTLSIVMTVGPFHFTAASVCMEFQGLSPADRIDCPRRVLQQCRSMQNTGRMNAPMSCPAVSVYEGAICAFYDKLLLLGGAPQSSLSLACAMCAIVSDPVRFVAAQVWHAESVVLSLVGVQV